MKNIILVLAVLFFLSPAHAAQESTPAVDMSLVDQVQLYFDNLSSFKATFLQTSTKAGAEKASGKMYYQKPGGIRIEYDAPTPYLIVSGGTWLIYYDKELEQVTHLPVSETPARFLIDEKVNLKEDFDIKSTEKMDSAIKIHMVPKKDIGATDLILGFKWEKGQPLDIDYWIIKDGQGIETTVALQGMEKNIPLEEKLFRFINPKFFKPR